MGFLRWPLLFALAYGVLWLRHELRAPASDQDPGEMPQLDLEEYFKSQAQNENPQDQNTLSYGFQKVARKPDTNSPNTDYRGVLNLEKLLAAKNDPHRLLEEASSQLQNIRRDELPERIIVLREVIAAKNDDLVHEIQSLFYEERDWISREIDLITVNYSLSGYISELFRLSLMADSENSSLHEELIGDFSSLLQSHPQALPALKFAIDNYAPWESEKWTQSLNPEQRKWIEPHPKGEAQHEIHH